MRIWTERWLELLGNKIFSEFPNESVFNRFLEFIEIGFKADVGTVVVSIGLYYYKYIRRVCLEIVESTVKSVMEWEKNYL